MKLPDNLKRIRKDNNLSQEQLAEKLGVSRQAVSKWESGQSYPEMDKVLMICKLFNYNIDELMNENVKEVSENKQSKININKYVDDFFAYITKTIRMFESMKFAQKIKCIFEQVIVAIIIWIAIAILELILGSIFSGIFSWLPSSIYGIMVRIFDSLYLVLGFVVGIVILLHIFKIRYLDYYDIVEEKEEMIEKEVQKDCNNKQQSAKILLEKNKEKIIIRDPVHSESKFLNGILKVIVLGIKAFVGFCALGFVITLVGLCAGLICSFLFIKTGFVFVGTLICILAGIAGNIVILEILYNFIISKKNSKTRIGITILASLIALGIGIGVVLIGCTKFNIVDDIDDSRLIRETFTFDMTDNMSIQTFGDIEYVISDNDDVIVQVDCYNCYTPYVRKNKYNCIFVDYTASNVNAFEIIRTGIEDINNKQIRDYDYMKIYVYSTQENIDIIKNNTYYENYSLRYEYEQKIETLNDKIEEQQKEIEDKENKIMELENIIEDYKYN